MKIIIYDVFFCFFEISRYHLLSLRGHFEISIFYSRELSFFIVFLQQILYFFTFFLLFIFVFLQKPSKLLLFSPKTHSSALSQAWEYFKSIISSYFFSSKWSLSSTSLSLTFYSHINWRLSSYLFFLRIAKKLSINASFFSFRSLFYNLF